MNVYYWVLYQIGDHSTGIVVYMRETAEMLANILRQRPDVCGVEIETRW